MVDDWKEYFDQSAMGYRLHVLADSTSGLAERFNFQTIGLDMRGLRILRLIEANPGITFGGITEITKLERSLVSRILQQLVKSHRIIRKISAGDARSFELYITKDGTKTCRLGDHLVSTISDVFFKPLKDEEKLLFDSFLTKLSNWISSREFSDIIENVTDDARSHLT